MAESGTRYEERHEGGVSFTGEDAELIRNKATQGIYDRLPQDLT